MLHSVPAVLAAASLHLRAILRVEGLSDFVITVLWISVRALVKSGF